MTARWNNQLRLRTNFPFEREPVGSETESSDWHHGETGLYHGAPKRRVRVSDGPGQNCSLGQNASGATDCSERSSPGSAPHYHRPTCLHGTTAELPDPIPLGIAGGRRRDGVRRRNQSEEISQRNVGEAHTQGILWEFARSTRKAQAEESQGARSGSRNTGSASTARGRRPQMTVLTLARRSAFVSESF